MLVDFDAQSLVASIRESSHVLRPLYFANKRFIRSPRKDEVRSHLSKKHQDVNLALLPKIQLDTSLTTTGPPQHRSGTIPVSSLVDPLQYEAAHRQAEQRRLGFKETLLVRHRHLKLMETEMQGDIAGRVINQTLLSTSLT